MLGLRLSRAKGSQLAKAKVGLDIGAKSLQRYLGNVSYTPLPLPNARV